MGSGTEEVPLDNDQASPPAWVSDAIAALWKAGLAGPGARPGAGAEALPPSDFEELVPGRLACGRAFGYLAESLEKPHASGASLLAAQASLRPKLAAIRSAVERHILALKSNVLERVRAARERIAEVRKGGDCMELYARLVALFGDRSILTENIVALYLCS